MIVTCSDATPSALKSAGQCCVSMLQTTSCRNTSGWVLELVPLIDVENHGYVGSDNIRELRFTTKWHAELHHTPLDLPISHNLVSKLQQLRILVYCGR